MSEDDGWEFVNLGDQQSFGIKTAGLEEKATACQMLVSRSIQTCREPASKMNPHCLTLRCTEPPNERLRNKSMLLAGVVFHSLDM